MRELKLPRELLVPKSEGAHAYLVQSVELEKKLYEIFGRNGLCLKIFRHRGELKPLMKSQWELSSITDATKIQNLFAQRGLAARVYGLVRVNKSNYAQVTDYLIGKVGLRPKLTLPFKEVQSKYGLNTYWATHSGSWVGGKLVDFGWFRFIDRRQNYANSLIEQIDREAESVLERMDLKKISFAGKSVLDLSCGLGIFCREAHNRGAKRIIGIDNKRAEEALELSNWLGYWNLDFFSLNLQKMRNEIRLLAGISIFDIVFAPLVLGHLERYSDWIAKLCKHILYFKGLQLENKESYRAALRQDFQMIEYLGEIGQESKPLFRCWKSEVQ